MQHDTTFCDHTGVCGNVFKLSGTENGLNAIRISGHTHLLYNLMNVPH
jgi:hypothetical protein